MTKTKCATTDNIIIRLKLKIAELILSGKHIGTNDSHPSQMMLALLLQAKKYPETHVATTRAHFILSDTMLEKQNSLTWARLEQKINDELNPTSTKVAIFGFYFNKSSPIGILETTPEHLAKAIHVVDQHIEVEFEVSEDSAAPIPLDEQYLIGLHTKVEAEDYIESRSIAFKQASA